MTWRQCERYLVICLSSLCTIFPRFLTVVLALWGLYSAIHMPESGSILNTIWLFLSTYFFAFSLIAYYKVCVVSPGSPTEFEVLRGDIEQTVPQVITNAVIAKRDGLPRYCRKCECWKPDRAHHCRKCRRCVLRMDHHCPWFATCIGLQNQRYFVQFLWYAFLLCLSVFIPSLIYLISFFRQQKYQYEHISVNTVAACLFSGSFSLALVAFAGYSTYLISQNCTTLESMEPSFIKTSMPSDKFVYKRPPTTDTVGNVFDLGSRQNFEQIMGTSLLHWIFPISFQNENEGLTYPVNETVLRKANERAISEQSLQMRSRPCVTAAP